MPAPKIAVVTGASSGIGDHLARFLANQGVLVYACARTPMPSSPGLAYTVLDIRDAVGVAAWVARIEEEHEHVDLLVNNAAIVGVRAPFSEIPLETWQEVISTNVLGAVTTIRGMLRLLGGLNTSTVVNISSIMGRFGRAGWSPYSVSKSALEGLTQALAQELFRASIRVVALHPARLNTALRRQVYGEEDLFPKESLVKVCHAIQWLLDHPDDPASGLTLSSDDFEIWSQTL